MDFFTAHAKLHWKRQRTVLFVLIDIYHKKQLLYMRDVCTYMYTKVGLLL